MSAAIACTLTEVVTLLGCSPIEASGAVTLGLGALLGGRLRMLSAVFAGTFAGMTPLGGLHGGVLVAAVFALALGIGAVVGGTHLMEHRTRPVGQGVGGRLGTLAFVAALPVALWMGFDSEGPQLTAFLGLGTLVASAGGALFAAAMGRPAPVRWVAAAGLVGAVLFRDAPEVAAGWYTGAFVGMSSARILPTWWHLAAAGLGSAVAWMGLASVLPGVGGTMGFAALLAVLLVALASRTLTDARSPRRRVTPGEQRARS